MPIHGKHKLLSGLFSNVCVGERECSAGQQGWWVQHLLGLNSVGLKVQHQNGCEDVLGTWPPLLSHLAKSCQGFQEYIYARNALLCCTRICKFATCGLKSPFLCLYPKSQTFPFSSLGCTVPHWCNQLGGSQQISRPCVGVRTQL